MGVFLEYWVERSQISNLSQIYNDLGKIADLTIIKALDDEVLALDGIQKESNAKIVNLKGDHNFNGEVWEALKKSSKNHLNLNRELDWYCFMIEIFNIYKNKKTVF